MWREREKKARNFVAPTVRGPTLLGPTLRAPIVSGFGPPPTFWDYDTKNVGRKIGLAKIEIPEVKDLQCAWLILFYCGVTRATFHVRSVRPDLTENFAEQHDEQVWRCFCELVGVAPAAPAASVRACTSLPLAAGGLGLRSVVRLRHAAHWASWADTIKMVQERHPEVVDVNVRAVEASTRRPALEQSIVAQYLREAEFAAPSWEELARGIGDAPRAEEEEPTSQAVETSFLTRCPFCQILT